VVCDPRDGGWFLVCEVEDGGGWRMVSGFGVEDGGSWRVLVVRKRLFFKTYLLFNFS
jgi:hypothetical protein